MLILNHFYRTATYTKYNNKIIRIVMLVDRSYTCTQSVFHWEYKDYRKPLVKHLNI